jgi:predicted O-methyltransferase YrrM
MGMMDSFPRWAQRLYFRFVRPHLFRRYRYLTDTIRETKAQRILEIGVWNGMQAELMIREAQKFHKDVEYYGFDLFEEMTPEMFKIAVAKHPPKMSVVKNDLEKTGARIGLFRGLTDKTLPAAAKILPPMDFIYIDGDHSLEGVANDWKNVQRLMGRHTVVIFDDYWNRATEGAKPLVDSLDTTKYQVEILPITDTVRKPDGLLTIQFARVRLRQGAEARA